MRAYEKMREIMALESHENFREGIQRFGNASIGLLEYTSANNVHTVYSSA